MITKLIERICRRGAKLDRFGLPTFNPSGLEQLQKELRGIHREIGFSTGKPKSQSKLKKLYYQLLRRGRRMCKRFDRELAPAKEALNAQTQLPPSQRLMAEEVIEMTGSGKAGASAGCLDYRQGITESERWDYYRQFW